MRVERLQSGSAPPGGVSVLLDADAVTLELVLRCGFDTLCMVKAGPQATHSVLSPRSRLWPA